MGHLAALLSKIGEDVSSTLLKMLQAASPKRGDAYGLASEEGVMISYSARRLRAHGNPMLGYKLTKILPNDPPQPIAQHGYAMVFDGRTWYEKSPSDISTVTNFVGSDPSRGIPHLMENVEGSYALAAMVDDRILCGRDPVGAVPVYFVESSKFAGLASNRKMLWTAGLEAQPLPPGHFAELTSEGVSTAPVRTLCQPKVKKITMKEAREELDRVLTRTVRARCRGLSRVALGFSGGIDSSLLAHYLDEVGVIVGLICVGMEDSTDFGAAELSADSLGLPIRLKSFTLEDVEEDLDTVLWSIEEPDPMKVGVALPLHWAARSAAESGNRVFFTGNGSDELFGGYHRYAKEYSRIGEGVGEIMFNDIADSHEVNFARDQKICSDEGLELRLPFADMNVIEFGLSLPLELKLPSDHRSPRKLILRTLARKLGLPKEITSKRKKAVQYSTGVHKALRRLAKRNGRNLTRYLSERFRNVREDRLKEVAVQ
ncbi:MAG: asparagine synthase-related protein [Candidatus Bathyarchaeia archaeon]